MKEISQNVFMDVIHEDKFKHIDISFKFLRNFKREESLLDYALGEILGEYSHKYPTKLEMARKKDELYGLNVYSYQDIICDNKVFNLTYHFLDPVYTGSSFDEYLEFIRETLSEPYISDELLEEIRYNYMIKIARTLDRPQRLASNNLIRIIGKDNHLINKDVDKRDLADGLTVSKVKNEYKKLINESTVYIYAIGNVDDNALSSYFGDIFSNNPKIRYENKTVTLMDYEDVIEEKDLSQSYLKIVYETEYCNKDENYYKWMTADALLGVVPNSMLFKEIREKRSLCYTISSSIMKSEGLSIVSSAISFDTYKEIVSLVDECIRMLKEKKYDEKELDTAKKILINSIAANSDDARNTIDFIHSNNINGRDYTIEKIIKLINDVTMDDVADVMKTYKRRLVYVLRGANDAEN